MEQFSERNLENNRKIVNLINEMVKLFESVPID